MTKSEAASLKKRDKKLIKEILSGNKDAFSTLIDSYKKRITAMGISFFRNDVDVEDFTQEVFIKAYTNLSSFRGDSLFSTWLTRIAYTTALNSVSRNKQYESIADETLIPALNDTPEDCAIKKATRQAVKEAVTSLPEKYAVCIDLYFFYDAQYEEIARITDLPVNTIKSHIFRAKKILKQKLEDFAVNA